MRANMLGRVRHRACYYDCRDSDPIRPHDIDRFPWLQEKPWKWEHQERGGYATWLRRNHRRRNRRTEDREVQAMINEGMEDYFGE